MFQYATAKSLAIKNNTKVLLDICEFKENKLRKFELCHYNIQCEISHYKRNYRLINKLYKGYFKFLKSLKIKFNSSHHFIESSLLFDKKVLSLNDVTYLDGYFQSEQYFSGIKEIILKEFTLKNQLSNYSKFVKKNIISKNSVSLHIRRGDYINNPNAHKIHGLCKLDYYESAINFMKDQIGLFDLFIFSDDIKWAKLNIKFENNYFIEDDQNRIPHEDIYLMSLCNHNIIANSSFSWWGAWLNQNQNKKVIAPKKWFSDIEMQKQSKDLIPDQWIRM